MGIDLAALFTGDAKPFEMAEQLTLDDLRRASDESIDMLLSLLEGLSDADVVFDPVDDEANDPYAVEGEENIGWNFGHLIAHVTASTEEWAAYSSILARGIAYPADPRLRYETPWREVITKAQCVQRLEESRRMRHGYLDTWPDTPFLDVKRELSPRFVDHFGEMNAPAAFIFGLKHEYGHHEQIREVRTQALAARQNA